LVTACDSAARLTARIDCEGCGGTTKRARYVLVLVILHHHAVVGMDAPAIFISESVRSDVLIAQDRECVVWVVSNLQSHAGRLIEFAIGLPSVDEPRLDLQFVAREDLNAYAVEEPRRVRGDIRRLIGPIVEVVITPQTDVRHENARLDIDASKRVNVITGIR